MYSNYRHLLFGSKGIDLKQISLKLDTLSSKRTFEPLQPIADSDIESFLKNERENAILSLIDEVNKNVCISLCYYGKYYTQHICKSWLMDIAMSRDKKRVCFVLLSIETRMA